MMRSEVDRIVKLGERDPLPEKPRPPLRGYVGVPVVRADQPTYKHFWAARPDKRARLRTAARAGGLSGWTLE